MINEYLKNMIIPNLKMHLLKSDWKYINEMFSEVYWTNYDGIERVTLKPIYPDTPAPQFSALNGAYLELTDWDYIKQKGTLL